jgi:hypothetical protein
MAANSSIHGRCSKTEYENGMGVLIRSQPPSASLIWLRLRSISGASGAASQPSGESASDIAADSLQDGGRRMLQPLPVMDALGRATGGRFHPSVPHVIGAAVHGQTRSPRRPCSCATAIIAPVPAAVAARSRGKRRPDVTDYWPYRGCPTACGLPIALVTRGITKAQKDRQRQSHQRKWDGGEPDLTWYSAPCISVTTMAGRW